MLENLLIGQTSEPSDPYFENVTLLLHGDGTNGGQNNTFVDSSTNNFTITRNGNTTQGSFSPYGDLWSNYFDGTGDYLEVSDNASLDIGGGAFTVECWVFPVTYGGAYRAIFAKRDGASSEWQLSLNNVDNKVAAYIGSTIYLTSIEAPLSQWSHVVLMHDGTNVSIYVNGVRGLNQAVTVSNGSAPFRIGAIKPLSSDFEYFPGYISNLRVVKGSAVYSGASFTSPTAPLTAITNTSLLTCQSNRFIDNSSNNFTITRNGDVSVQRFSPFSPTSAYSTATIGGSGYFDGTGDYLSVSPTALSTGDFTFECWIYSTGSGQYQYIYDTRASTNDAAGFCVIFNHASYANKISIYSNGFIGTPTINVSLNTWTHFALVRSSGSWQTYINGVVDISSTSASRTLSSTALKIGTGQALDYYYNGYLSNYRIVTSAVYTSAFTPPTAPLTAITNTSLLLNFTNASIFDNAMMADLETVGNAQIDTAVKKFGTGSLEFDGSSDYLTAPSSPVWIMSGDWTMECWIYPTRVTGVQVILDTRNNTTNAGPVLYLNGSSLVIDNGIGSKITAGTISTNSWQHVSATRSGNSWRLFVNGTQVGSTTSITTSYSSAYGFCVGKSSYGEHYAGYIDDIRITRGVARYTANFTPPTAAFPNK